MKLVGDLGFRNYRGLLVLIVPATVAEVVRQELAQEIAANEAAGLRFVEAPGGGGYVAEFAVRLRPGMRKAVHAREVGCNTGLQPRHHDPYVPPYGSWMQWRVEVEAAMVRRPQPRSPASKASSQERLRAAKSGRPAANGDDPRFADRVSSQPFK